MKQVMSRTAVLTMVIAGAIAFSVQGSNIKEHQKTHRALRGNVDVSKALAYAFPGEKGQSHVGGPSESNRVPLSTALMSSAYASPGVTVGNTYYDMQHSGSMGRMIAVGPHSGATGYTKVHFGWTYLGGYAPPSQPRSYAYNHYNSQNGTVSSEFEVLMPDEYGGYVNVDVTPDNRAVVGGHNNDGTGYAPELHIQWADSWIVWRIPDSVQGYDQNDPTERALWPKFFFQYGTDTVVHVVALISDKDNSANAIVYYRRVGHEFSTEAGWEYPPYIVDTVQTFGHNITGQRQGNRVALAWTAGLPYDAPWCDTCSAISIYDGYLIGQMDNDLYCQQSLDQGATWQRKANITQIPIGMAAYKPVGDISLLFDTYNRLHIVYPACPWPADLCWDDGGYCWSKDWYVDNARLYHWSENVPYIRPIADQVYEVQGELLDSCWAGWYALRIARPTLSECDGKLYTIWTQFNNPKEGVIDDCAAWGYDGDPTGAANGDIWYSVSSDYGMTWDFARNLTNSYTPHCDPKFAEECQSDYWASMTRYGKQVGMGENWSAADVVDPSGGGYLGDYFLDIQYVNDLDAGSVVSGEGSWTNSPVKWFRIPCVEPVPCPVFRADWTYLGLPTYVRPGTWLDTTLIVENIGNTGLNYTVEVIYDDGSSGWLGIRNFSGFIPTGLCGLEYGNITLNQNLMTEIGDYYGRLRFETDACNQTEPFDVEIVLCIRDTVPPVYCDSVQTNCLSLIVSNTGNTGNMGRMGRGKVNMDYYPEDCDSTAQVYLFDGSPIVMGINGADTTINSAFYGVNPYTEAGFYPGQYPISTLVCGLYGGVKVFETGHFIAKSFPLAIDKVYVAPAFDCEWILQYMRVRSADGLAHENVMLGEVIDWDVPWDYRVDDPGLTRGFVNYGGVDPARGLIYQQGYDAHGAGSDTLYPYNCQFNDNRFAGMAFVKSYLNASLKASVPYSAFVAENDSLLIYNGFVPGTLYQEMTMSGFRTTDSLEDLHSVMCFENAIDIGPEDVYEVVTVIATVQNGTLSDLQAAIDDAKAWYEANSGIGLFDDELVGFPNIFDCMYCCIDMGKFYLDGQPFSILDIDNFTEWLLRNPGGTAKYDCFEQVDVSGPTPGVPDHYVNILDLDYLIGYLLRGEYPSLPPCT